MSPEKGRRKRDKYTHATGEPQATNRRKCVYAAQTARIKRHSLPCPSSCPSGRCESQKEDSERARWVSEARDWTRRVVAGEDAIIPRVHVMVWRQKR